MFGHAANRLQAVRARGVGGARGLTIFSEDARTMKPESYPWKTRAARAHRPTLPATTHTQCTLTYWLTNYRYANPSQRIQNNVSQNKSTGSPESKSRSLDTPHTRALCVTVWHSPGPRRCGGRPGEVSKLPAWRSARCTHLTSGLFTRRSDTHCAAPALAVSPRSHPTIFGAKNPGFRSSIAIAANMPTATRHAPTHSYTTIFATIANRRACDDVGGCEYRAD